MRAPCGRGLEKRSTDYWLGELWQGLHQQQQLDFSEHAFAFRDMHSRWGTYGRKSADPLFYKSKLELVVMRLCLCILIEVWLLHTTIEKKKSQ